MEQAAKRWTAAGRAHLALLLCAAFLLQPVQAALHGFAHDHSGAGARISALPGGGHVHHRGQGHLAAHGHHHTHAGHVDRADHGAPGHDHPAYDRGEPTMRPNLAAHSIPAGPLPTVKRLRIGPARETGLLDDVLDRAGPPLPPERGLSDCRAPPAGRS